MYNFIKEKAFQRLKILKGKLRQPRGSLPSLIILQDLLLWWVTELLNHSSSSRYQNCENCIFIINFTGPKLLDWRFLFFFFILSLYVTRQIVQSSKEISIYLIWTEPRHPPQRSTNRFLRIPFSWSGVIIFYTQKGFCGIQIDWNVAQFRFVENHKFQTANRKLFLTLNFWPPQPTVKQTKHDFNLHLWPCLWFKTLERISLLATG